MTTHVAALNAKLTPKAMKKRGGRFEIKTIQDRPSYVEVLNRCLGKKEKVELKKDTTGMRGLAAQFKETGEVSSTKMVV